MRRWQQIGFCIAILVCGGLLYWQRSQRQAEEPSLPASPSEPAAAPMPAPRLALTPPSRDAGIADTNRAVPDEQALMERIRAVVQSNPPLAEALAREGRSRFPNGPEADERDSLLVDALINQQRIGAARSETYYYFDHHPGGRFSNHLLIMTGVHPRPTGPGR
jgi:hypothetical protein